jgi:putative transposase
MRRSSFNFFLMNPLEPRLRFRVTGCFNALAIQQDEHLLRVLHYVERNPVRAGLVERPERWPWFSAHFWREGDRQPNYHHLGPFLRPSAWLEFVGQPLRAGE